jgi:hypothetical protein
MVTAMRGAGEHVWVDLDDIVPSAVWMEEIKTAIANADSVIFVISPDSVASEVCGVDFWPVVPDGGRGSQLLDADQESTAVASEA